MAVFMDDQRRPHFLPFYLVQRLRVNVHVDRKIFFQQRIVYMFGPERLGEILQSPLPVIFPVINYETSFDVNIFILF